MSATLFSLTARLRPLGGLNGIDAATRRKVPLGKVLTDIGSPLLEEADRIISDLLFICAAQAKPPIRGLYVVWCGVVRVCALIITPETQTGRHSNTGIVFKQECS